MLVEWDENKRLKNIEEHGVDFRLAAAIFLSPVIELVDDRNDYGETRIQALGTANNEFFVVIYTWRGDVRRIISSWKAGKKWKKKISRDTRTIKLKT